MQFEEVIGDKMLDGGEENRDVSVWNDVGVQEFFLREDMSEITVFATPVVKRIGDTISRTSAQRPWSRRSGSLWRCHFWIMANKMCYR